MAEKKIPLPIWEAARAVLKRNGMDPDHPAFKAPYNQTRAADLLQVKGGWERDLCERVAAGCSR